MQTIQKLFAPRDLTQGSPMSGIALFSIPLLLGNLAQQLYNTVDAIVVGRYVGDAALGAVGLAGPVLNLMIVLFMGISTGATIVVSQYFGAKDREALSRAVGTTVMLTLWSGILMSVIGMLCARPLLLLLGTPEEMLDMASDYLFIIMLGITGMAFYAILSGVLRGLGDSVSPLIYLLIASLLNIVLDIAFITLLGMTTDGVAWATIIAQGVSAVLCFLRLRRMRDTLDLNRHTLRLDKPIMNRIVRLGVPAGMTQMIFSLSSILVQSLTNSLGPNVVTAVTAVMRGAGETVIPMWISIIVTVVIRMPIAYLWAYLTRTPAMPAGDPMCLYGSLLISWLLGCAMSIWVYLRGKWKRKCLWDDTDAEMRAAFSEADQQNEGSL